MLVRGESKSVRVECKAAASGARTGQATPAAGGRFPSRRRQVGVPRGAEGRVPCVPKALGPCKRAGWRRQGLLVQGCRARKVALSCRPGAPA